MERFKQTVYYWLIAALSLFVMVFFPLLGSSVGIEIYLPTTPAEWLVWLSPKISICIINMLVFHMFIRQATINIKDDDRYKYCLHELYSDREHKIKKIKLPGAFYAEQYIKKGGSLLLTSALSVFVLGEVILAYDPVSLITYSLSIIMAVVFGVIEMLTIEDYWTVQLYNYLQGGNHEHERQTLSES